MQKSGFTEEESHQQLRALETGAANIPCGNGKKPIYLPIDYYSQMALAGAVSHELEHALEANCRPLFKVLRNLGTIIQKVVQKFNRSSNVSQSTKQTGIISNIRTESMQLEKILQYRNGTIVQTDFDKNTGKVIEPQRILNCADSKAAFLEHNGKTEEQYRSGIRDTMRECYVFPNVANLDMFNYINAILKYFSLKNIINIEKPAYATQDKVERYAYNMSEQEMSKASGTLYLYNELEHVIKEELWLCYKSFSNMK